MKMTFIFLVTFITSALFAAETPARLKERFKKQTKTFKISHGGYERNYAVFTPSITPVRGTKIPLLIALHGGGGSAEDWPLYTDFGFEKLAEEDNFIVVYPDAIDGNWNDQRNVSRFYSHANNVDDAGFLATLIDTLIRKYSIDSKRVYMTGASNGGIMAHYFASVYADKVAAIAPVISNVAKNLEGKMYPSRPVSVLVMNGTDDPILPWNGGDITLGNKENGAVLSTSESLGIWAKSNGCGDAGTPVKVKDLHPFDGTKVSVTTYKKCEANTDVVLYTIQGGGHAWPGKADALSILGRIIVGSITGKKSKDIEACTEIWNFFKTHQKI